VQFVTTIVQKNLFKMSEEMDLILRLYYSGLSGILENIFFGLPLETLLRCREVHPYWKDLIDDLFDSSKRKAKKLEKKAWMSNSPLMATVEIPHFPCTSDIQFDIQSGKLIRFHIQIFKHNFKLETFNPDNQIVVFGCVFSSKRK
jgi:hypothetical protein